MSEMKTEMLVALTAAKQLEHNHTLKEAWEESKVKTREGMVKEGIVDTDIGTKFRSYQTFTMSLANSLLIHLEQRKLIVVSSEKRDDAVGMMATSPMIMCAAEFALGEIISELKDDMLKKERNNG